MGVPRRPRAGFERNTGTSNAGGRGRAEQRIDTDGAGEPIARSLAGLPSLASLDFHCLTPAEATHQLFPVLEPFQPEPTPYGLLHCKDKFVNAALINAN